MTPIRSILLLAGAVSSVSFAVFAGHALSTHQPGPVAIGAGFLVAGIVLLALFARSGRAA